MITRRLKILYNTCGKSRYKAINGEILSVKTVFGGDELVIFDGGEKGRKECILEGNAAKAVSLFSLMRLTKKCPFITPKRGLS